MVASSELAKAFAEEGYVIVPNLLTRAETIEIKRETRLIVDRVREDVALSGGDPVAALRTGVVVGLAARSEFFKRAVADPRIVDILEAIQGPNVEFLSDKVVYKQEGTEFGSPWHQDWPYWRGTNKISVWIPLDDATPENGTLKVLPRSHIEFVTHDGDSSDGYGFGHRLRPDAIDESQAVTAELEAGGAVFFHDLTLHASHPNQSGADRWVWIPTYRDAQAEDPAYPWAVAAAVVRGSR
ncbi:phytanoyl-CoA dioxygenase family protein [Candidatus Poribacteria bacterium]|nr:phytanoyl-CoA dioxygenase family protein [Candidatus Poribacteria bacterium]